SFAMQKSSISFASHVHEAEIAHAAGRAVVGRNALVGSARGTLWYASGATNYYDVSNDLLSASQGPDLSSYFAAFDAIILERNFSAVTENPQHKSLTSWYADGTLNLRGFYLTNDDTLPYLILSGGKPGHIEGHVKRKDGLI